MNKHKPLEDVILEDLKNPEKGNTVKIEIAMALANELHKLKRTLKPKDDKIAFLEKENRRLTEHRLKLQVNLMDIEKRWKEALLAPQKLQLRLGNANRTIKRLEKRLEIYTQTKT